MLDFLTFISVQQACTLRAHYTGALWVRDVTSLRRPVAWLLNTHTGLPIPVAIVSVDLVNRTLGQILLGRLRLVCFVTTAELPKGSSYRHQRRVAVSWVLVLAVPAYWQPAYWQPA